MRVSLGKRHQLLAAALLLLVAGGIAGRALGAHWANDGWYHRHYNYPARPNGLSAIKSTFGQPCNADASYWTIYYWRAADNGTDYRVVHHKKLSGRGVPGFAIDQGVGSTNLFYDVRGHIGNLHRDDYVLHGIYGYNCRYITGTTKYSTHAWGIAVDQNSAYEHVGSSHKHTHSIDSQVAQVWQDHNWYWGISFGDAMHFQYATGY